MDTRLLTVIRETLARAKNSPFYARHFADIAPDDVRSLADFRQLPFTGKDDLRAAYPLGLAAVPEKKIVRIHSSSGTTGVPVIIPYTKKDVADWAAMFKRCYQTAGVTNRDRVQITPGYGLWTAGIGFQLGAELLGAMTIPTGPGNTEKQIQMLIDLQTTVLTATSSYALLLAEEIQRRGIGRRINLKKALIGSERWGEKMRKRIALELGVELYDIYGLTEIYGPGIGISCARDCGIHLWNDYFYYELIDPHTGKNVNSGEIGELVITTLRKEGAPLIRYRTHDLTREISGVCPCGLPYPRIATLTGRSDDMVKIKGVILFPSQVDELLTKIDGASSEYRIEIEHRDGRDALTLFFESAFTGEHEIRELTKQTTELFKHQIGILANVKVMPVGGLPRSEKKTARIIDRRD